MLALCSLIHAWLATTATHALDPPERSRADGDGGQTTAEYALVILGAAAVAVLILSWATQTNLIGKLFDFVLDKVMGRAG